MKEYLKKNGIRLGVVIIAVVLVALLAGRVMGGKADFLTNAIVTVREPIRQAAASVANWLDGAYGYLFEYEQLKAENESLRIQLAEAQEEARAGRDAVDENERFGTCWASLRSTRTSYTSPPRSSPGAPRTGAPASP